MKDFESPEASRAWYDANGLTQIINVCGTMTSIGGSVATARVRDATAAMMSRFVRIHELQEKASETIARLTGAETGCITASACAGVSMAIAGTMTGLNPGAAERLPTGTPERNGVAVQLGHLSNFGAPVATGIELTGARVIQVGQATLSADYQLEAALDERTAAALYVVSHHSVHYGQIPFDRFVRIAHARNVPVIVDAASEYDLTGFIAKGADIVVYSGHKFLGGPTAGIIAGRRDLVRAAYLQNIGIARGMKVGKESIAGTIAAMQAWMQRDHAGIRAREDAALTLWETALRGIPGISTRREDDPTGNPIERLRVRIDPTLAGASAATFARALGESDPSILVRDHEVELGSFHLDPCNLLPGQAQIVADTLAAFLARGHDLTAQEGDVALARNATVDSYLRWNSQAAAG